MSSNNLEILATAAEARSFPLLRLMQSNRFRRSASAELVRRTV